MGIMDRLFYGKPVTDWEKAHPSVVNRLISGMSGGIEVREAERGSTMYGDVVTMNVRPSVEKKSAYKLAQKWLKDGDMMRVAKRGKKTTVIISRGTEPNLLWPVDGGSKSLIIREYNGRSWHKIFDGIKCFSFSEWYCPRDLDKEPYCT